MLYLLLCALAAPAFAKEAPTYFWTVDIARVASSEPSSRHILPDQDFALMIKESDWKCEVTIDAEHRGTSRTIRCEQGDKIVSTQLDCAPTSHGAANLIVGLKAKVQHEITLKCAPTASKKKPKGTAP